MTDMHDEIALDAVLQRLLPAPQPQSGARERLQLALRAERTRVRNSAETVAAAREAADRNFERLRTEWLEEWRSIGSERALDFLGGAAVGFALARAWPQLWSELGGVLFPAARVAPADLALPLIIALVAAGLGWTFAISRGLITRTI
ncbi:MAG: hypothetical protein R3E77_01075 [Steroidobacteraceae bacterium]